MNKFLSVVFILLACNAHSVAVSTAVIASSGAAAANAQRASANANQTFMRGQTNQMADIKGAMTCAANYESNKIGYHFFDCYYGGVSMPIKTYFKKFKPDDASEIVSIVFNDNNRKFIIYYR